MKHLFFLLCSLLATTLTSCEEVEQSRVPSLRVSLNANIEHRSELHGLKVPGGTAQVTKRFNEAPFIGFGGLLIIRGYTYDNEVYCFDLSCPIECKTDVCIEAKDELTWACPKCGSTYTNLLYGNPMATSGPAKEKGYRLRTYASSLTYPLLQINN